MIDYQDAEIIKGDVMVALEWIGEGFSGDYDPADPEDQPLLRFTVFRREDGVWQPVDNGSYCTLLPATISGAQKQIALNVLMNEFYEPVTHNEPIKGRGEFMSYLSIRDLKRKKTEFTVRLAAGLVLFIGWLAVVDIWHALAGENRKDNPRNYGL